MTRVLIFPCGSEIGLEIARALEWEKSIELFGGSSVESNHGRFVFDNYIGDLPFVDDNNFIESLNAVINEHGIDFVFPAHDSVVLKLSQMADRLDCMVLGSAFDTCRLARSKKSTYEYFVDKISVPKIFIPEENDFEFPVFLKPDVGQGSKGTYLAENKEDLEFFLKKDNSLLILEYLPGKEYTVDCFTDRHGKLRFVGGRERTRIMNGISVAAKEVVDSQFEEIANIINSDLELRGAWFFQLKENADGVLTLMEIGPRIAGTMGFYRNLGVNLPLLTVFDALNIDVKIAKNNYSLEMDRALYSRFKTDLQFENVYVDLEDCLIVKNELNVLLLQFLYKCFNRGVKIHLLTRYTGDVMELLGRFRVDSLFDTISIAKRGFPKSSYIKSSSAIFIDDSFRERLEVYEALGIPVFDLNSLEMLI